MHPIHVVDVLAGRLGRLRRQRAGRRPNERLHRELDGAAIAQRVAKLVEGEDAEALEVVDD